MNMKQFRYVVVLAAEGSFSRAADKLGISQPSLSQYLKKIEKEVGAQLFDRSGSEIRLTDAGRVYLDSGRNILDIERQMKNKISDITECKYGDLIIGISPHRAIYLMPEAIKKFQRIYPGIHVSLEERTGSLLLENAARGDFDLCITAAPADDNIFQTVKILDEEVILAVPIENELNGSSEADRKYPVIDIKDIDHANFITLSGTQRMQKMLDKICSEYDLRYNNAVSVNSIEAQISMVRKGLGMALIPSSVGQAETEGITFFSVKQKLPVREIIAVYRNGRHVTKPMRDMVNILRKLGGLEEYEYDSRN